MRHRSDDVIENNLGCFEARFEAAVTPSNRCPRLPSTCVSLHALHLCLCPFFLLWSSLSRVPTRALFGVGRTIFSPSRGHPPLSRHSTTTPPLQAHLRFSFVPNQHLVWSSSLPLHPPVLYRHSILAQTACNTICICTTPLHQSAPPKPTLTSCLPRNSGVSAFNTPHISRPTRHRRALRCGLEPRSTSPPVHFRQANSYSR